MEKNRPQIYQIFFVPVQDKILMTSFAISIVILSTVIVVPLRMSAQPVLSNTDNLHYFSVCLGVEVVRN